MIPVKEFKQQVQQWADDIGVNPKEIHVREMTNKWASCSTKGRLTFSYALLEKDESERAYAIAHELLHLRYPSHNKMFKRLLESYLKRKGFKTQGIVL